MARNITSINDIYERYGLTRKQLANMMDIPERTLKAWDLGERRPPDWTLKIIDNLLFEYYGF